MTAYSMLAVTPGADAWVPDDIGPANARAARHGGRHLARTAAHEQLEGAQSPSALRIVIEWPSAEAAKAFMADPDHAPHPAARTAGSTSVPFLVEGVDDLA